jgi:isopentenyl diphosphate isomerase/L-lactate dehydrogenase-like FMN-dependent dehydrogenase
MDTKASKIRNVMHARERARRRLPKALFDYVDGGAEDERTEQDNLRAFTEINLLTRAAAYVTDPKLSTRVLDHELSMPLFLGPVGGVRLFHADGDRAVARAAGGAGTAYAMSTGTRTAPEDMIATASGPLWFQLYFRGTLDDSVRLVDRVADLGFGVLFVTVDAAGQGNIERLFAHQGTFPIRKTFNHALHYAPQMIMRPGWTAEFMLDGMPTNFAEFQRARAAARGTPRPQVPAPEAVADPGPSASVYTCPTWADIEWIRTRWTRPLVIKGILTPDDARRARDHGAEGIVVSNHGGRQLDTAPATLRVLPKIKEAVGNDLEIFIDGGIRRGSDVLKAVALGATACMIGRPYVYGLSAAGQAGVERILEIFRIEMLRALGQMGVASVADLDASCIETSRFHPLRFSP